MTFQLRRLFFGTALAALSPPAGAPPPDVLNWSIDFLNEVYTDDGVPVAIADIIDKPARVDATDGLEILEDDIDGVVAIIGDLLTDVLLMDWTVVIEYKTVDEDFGVIPLWLHETDDSHSFTIYHQDFLDRVEVTDSGFIVREVDISIPVFIGVHKIAITRTADFLSVSVDGGSVSTSSTDVNIPGNMNQPTLAGFGGPVGDFSYNNCFIRSMLLIDPVDDADLPTLSA